MFLFSDEDILPSLPALSSEGPGPELEDPEPVRSVNRPIVDLPAWNGESDPIVFTSSAQEQAGGGDRVKGVGTRTVVEKETVFGG